MVGRPGRKSVFLQRSFSVSRGLDRSLLRFFEHQRRIPFPKRERGHRHYHDAASVHGDVRRNRSFPLGIRALLERKGVVFACLLLFVFCRRRGQEIMLR